MENGIVRYRGIDIVLTALLDGWWRWSFDMVEASGYECGRTFDVYTRYNALQQAKLEIDLALRYSLRVN